MPEFSRKSKTILETCDYRLQIICNGAIKITDFSVLCGERGKVEQNRLFDEGLSLLTFPYSRHNVKPSLAVDLAPYPIDFGDIERFQNLGQIFLYESVFQRFKINWGGFWNWKDWGHFELYS